ncbi:hypothetical protein BJ742DRAFT_843048 [Cladochytrium replicatum]|nr:hypothetical protein BJ742DRAFT_843048 [Cladochytrium replicatum]
MITTACSLFCVRTIASGCMCGDPMVLVSSEGFWNGGRAVGSCRVTYDAMDSASMFGRVDALEWWKRSGLEMKWT